MTFFDRDAETVDSAALEKHQIHYLKQTVKQAKNAPYYREVFKNTGLSEDSIKSLDDLKRIPFTTKDTLRENYPYGLVAVPRQEIVRLHSSSGTTGRATVIFHSIEDINNWTNLVARCMYMTGVRQTDVFQNMMGYGLFTGGLGFHYGAERIGALVIPSGPGNTKRQIALMREFETTAIHIIPSYALHMAKAFEEEGVDPKDLKLKIAFLGAEPHSEKTRQRIEQALNLNAYNSYGLSEMNGPGVAFECTEKNGMHLWEDSYILELINPDTLEPAREGEEGEIVLTTLKRTCMPILRYRTKDIAAVYSEPCACGRTHRRISRIKGRTDDMLIVKGVNMYPVQIEKTLMANPGVGTNFQIILDSIDGNDVMTIKAEVTEAVFKGDVKEQEHLKKTLTDQLRSEILITPKLDLVEPGCLPRSEGKAVRVFDNRAQWG